MRKDLNFHECWYIEQGGHLNEKAGGTSPVLATL